MQLPTVLLLAGGEGKRFAPLAGNKLLMPFCGKPFIAHLLDMIIAAGFTRIVVTTTPAIEGFLKAYPNLTGVEIIASPQPQPLGMADAVLHAKNHITGPVLIVGGDLVYPSLFEEIKRTITPETYGVIVGKQVHEHTPAGYLRLQGEHVVGIVEKPEAGAEPSNLINLVFHYFAQPHDFFDLLKNGDSNRDDIYEQALSTLLTQNEFAFVTYKEPWVKLKYPHYVLDVCEFMFAGIRAHKAKSAKIAPSATIEGEVYIDENARVFENAVIKGPAYIGRNAIVGNNALVRNCLVEEGATVGYGSEAGRSYIGPRSALHHAYAGDSILEENVNLSWGSVTANMRLDKKNVSIKVGEEKISSNRSKLGAIIAKDSFIGVNAAIMPGICLPEGSKVMPGSVVFKTPTTDSLEQEHSPQS